MATLHFWSLTFVLFDLKRGLPIPHFCCTSGHETKAQALLCQDSLVRRAWSQNVVCGETHYYEWTLEGLKEFRPTDADYDTAFPVPPESKIVQLHFREL